MATNDPQPRTAAVDAYFAHQDEIASSNAWKTHQRLRQLMVSINIFTGNTRDVLKLLAALPTRQVFELIGPEANVEQKEKMMTEVMRLTFNFLSAARSLNYHLDNFRAHYEHDSRLEFNRQLKRRWRNLPITAVVQEMRNLFVHDEIPPSNVTFHFDASGSFDISISVDIDAVLLLRQWSERDRVFLETLRYPAGLAHMVKPYSDAAMDFLSWLLPWHQNVAEGWVATQLDKMNQESDRLRNAMESEVADVEPHDN